MGKREKDRESEGPPEEASHSLTRAFPDLEIHSSTRPAVGWLSPAFLNSILRGDKGPLPEGRGTLISKTGLLAFLLERSRRLIFGLWHVARLSPRLPELFQERLPTSLKVLGLRGQEPWPLVWLGDPFGRLQYVTGFHVSGPLSPTYWKSGHLARSVSARLFLVP